MTAESDGDNRDLFFHVDIARLRETTRTELGLRLAFGAAASLLAGVVSIAFGPRVGGVFLAFPAILPAGLTLIEKRDGLGECTQDVIGSVIGALGLVAFAIVAGGALRRFAIGTALAVALGAWLAFSVGAYVILELARRRVRSAQ
jgi:hypothetical protein